MSKLKISPPVRIKKRSLSSYASFALFVAAAAIALSTMIFRVGNDRMNSLSDGTVPSSSNLTKTTSAAITDGSSGEDSSSEQITSGPSKKQTARTSPQKADVRQDEPIDTDSLEDSEETAAIQVMGNPGSYVRPSGGAVIKPCSLKQLAYSRTMKDWRVHNGLDIAAEKGEIVKSAGEGKVTDVMNDLLYGTTVVVNQNDGLMVYYRGLNSDTAVRKGENIAVGATVGTVGEIPCEAADGIHLHIEVRSDNRYLDPAEILGIR